MLEALGVVIDLGPEGVARCVREVGIGFCFAQRFHAAMRFAAPVRRELGTPTTFNFLGPLANPAGATRRTIGVSDPAMADRVINTLAALGTERALVFYGHDGLDELTVTTTSTVHELHDGDIRVYDVDPTDFGIPVSEMGGLAGGDAAGNAEAVHKTLAGAAGPIRDIVALNAAAALVVADLVPGPRHGRRARARAARRRLGGGNARSAGARVRGCSRSRRRLMAPALECPACGMRHRLDGLEPASTFRCERCGQKLLVPTTTTGGATAPASVPDPGGTVAPPPRRRAGASPAAAAATGVTVTLPASGAAPAPVPPEAAPSRSSRPSERRRVAWYWRLLAWIVAVPLGFVLAVVPSYELGFISKDDVLDVFVGSGTDRYVRLGVVTLIWAVVTAVLVQLFVEVGRWLASRRRRHATACRGGDSQVPAVSS